MQIFWGIVSAIIVFLFRESVSNARQQKEIAARLASYILHWNIKLTKDEGLLKLSYIGFKWQKEVTENIRSGIKADEILKLNAEYEEKLKQIFAEFETKSDEVTPLLKMYVSRTDS